MINKLVWINSDNKSFTKIYIKILGNWMAIDKTGLVVWNNIQKKNHYWSLNKA